MLAIGSVGSLSPELPVGSLLCPDDFIALHLGLSIFADARAHRRRASTPLARAKSSTPGGRAARQPRDGGVYWQAIGPRFETPAEIRLIAAHADVVGMTIASECIVAAELGLAYAALCVVDNLANGIGAGALDVVELEAAASPTRPPARRPGRGAAAARRGRAVSAKPSTVTGAVLDGETVGCAARTGRSSRSGPRSPPSPATRRSTPAAAPGRAARQRPHPRGDDALPRLRRRPAADALAARRGSGRSRRSSRPRTSTGARASPARRCSAPARPASGTCTGTRRRPPARSPTPACGRRSGRRFFDPTATPTAMRRARAAQPRRAGQLGAGDRRPRSPRTRSTRSARSSLRWIAELGAERGLPIHIHLSETEQEVDDCLAAHGLRPAAYLDRPRHAERADRARPRRLARPRGARADRRPRLHRRHQPGRQHEARGRRRLPLPGRAARRGRGRARHRRRRLERLARPPQRPEDLRPRPEARRRRPHRDRRRRRPGRSPPAPGRRCWAGGRRRSRSAPPPTSSCCGPTPPSWRLGDLASDLVYAASGADRRHDRRRRRGC